MGTATLHRVEDVETIRDNEVSRDNSSASQAYTNIAKVIVEHQAIKELDRFGNLIYSYPMDDKEIKTFFATVWAFFKDVPSGIISLAAKITDELLKNHPWEASAQAAYVLYASVDEYGLQQFQTRMLSTHHQMFKELITHLGITDADLFSDEYILPTGIAMGDNTYRYYRSGKLGEALGFHLASEMTSSREFQYFLQGFQQYPDSYRLQGKDDPILTFFTIHCDVEPMHVATGRDVLVNSIIREPWVETDAMTGAMAFMNGFEQMFKSINELFEQRR